jgi:hypothetical protein
MYPKDPLPLSSSCYTVLDLFQYLGQEIKNTIVRFGKEKYSVVPGSMSANVMGWDRLTSDLKITSLKESHCQLSLRSPNTFADIMQYSIHQSPSNEESFVSTP